MFLCFHDGGVTNENSSCLIMSFQVALFLCFHLIIPYNNFCQVHFSYIYHFVCPRQLQDYGKAPSGETEVQFRLTRTTLEPMLKSMAYISQQLSAPANKVAVINLKVFSSVYGIHFYLSKVFKCLPPHWGPHAIMLYSKLGKLKMG